MLNAFFSFFLVKDDQNASLGEVVMKTQEMIASNDEELIWADTFAMDEEGNLWATTNKLPFIVQGKLDWTSPASNFRLIKILTDDKTYLLP